MKSFPLRPADPESHYAFVSATSMHSMTHCMAGCGSHFLFLCCLCQGDVVCNPTGEFIRAKVSCGLLLTSQDSRLRLLSSSFLCLKMYCWLALLINLASCFQIQQLGWSAIRREVMLILYQLCFSENSAQIYLKPVVIVSKQLKSCFAFQL